MNDHRRDNISVDGCCAVVVGVGVGAGVLRAVGPGRFGVEGAVVGGVSAFVKAGVGALSSGACI